jgi:arylsulfatase A-like enzyme
MKPIRLVSSILIALAAFQLSVAAQSARPMPRRPNIILIVADNLAASDLSCYGQTQFQTPNLDKLAAEGVRFSRYSAGAPATSPARAALLTGKTIGFAAKDVTLDPGDVTIAQLLKDSGYFTSVIGEWDLGGKDSSGAPWLKGFDEFAGYFTPADAANPYADYIWRYESDPSSGDEPYSLPVYPNLGGKKGQYIPDWLITLVINFTKKHTPERFNNHQPFFLMLNCPIPGNGDRYVPTDAPYSEEPWPAAERNRAAMIARLDNYVGQLLQQLNKIGQATNTVIFFTSDTAPQKAGGIDPKFFGEDASTNDLYVPMIVHWPGRITAGRVSDLESSACDFLPTAAGIGLVKPPAKIDGTSLFPIIFGPALK